MQWHADCSPLEGHPHRRCRYCAAGASYISSAGFLMHSSGLAEITPAIHAADIEADGLSAPQSGDLRARVAPHNSEYKLVIPADAGPKDVLIVEDEPYLCDLISDVLEAEGHETRKASNGLDALQMISERRPQLVLLDLMMPVMDGWEFMSELRSNPAWRDVPVVIITAVYDVAKTQAITDARAVLTKPFDIDQLSEVVRRYAG
jgi:two-component system, chemotaxis family, chemotaxis protein CheY